MPKVSAFDRDILKRVETLERALKSKDGEIETLSAKLRDVEKSFADEIKQRDVVITELSSKIDNLVQSTATDSNDTEQEKQEHDLLIIGDSIIRHVDGNAVNPGGETTVECLPGARTDEVIDKFRELSKVNSYKKIVVHVGSNMIPKFTRQHTADKIVECLETVRKLSPNSKLAYSFILPKEGDHLLDGIDEVNYRVARSGSVGPPRTRYGFVNHRNYFLDHGLVDCRLLNNDSIHPSGPGIRALERSLKSINDS